MRDRLRALFAPGSDRVAGQMLDFGDVLLGPLHVAPGRSYHDWAGWRLCAAGDRLAAARSIDGLTGVMYWADADLGLWARGSHQESPPADAVGSPAPLSLAVGGERVRVLWLWPDGEERLRCQSLVATVAAVQAVDGYRYEYPGRSPWADTRATVYAFDFSACPGMSGAPIIRIRDNHLIGLVHGNARALARRCIALRPRCVEPAPAVA